MQFIILYYWHVGLHLSPTNVPNIAGFAFMWCAPLPPVVIGALWLDCTNGSMAARPTCTLSKSLLNRRYHAQLLCTGS